MKADRLLNIIFCQNHPKYWQEENNQNIIRRNFPFFLPLPQGRFKRAGAWLHCYAAPPPVRFAPGCCCCRLPCNHHHSVSMYLTLHCWGACPHFLKTKTFNVYIQCIATLSMSSIKHVCHVWCRWHDHPTRDDKHEEEESSNTPPIKTDEFFIILKTSVYKSISHGPLTTTGVSASTEGCLWVVLGIIWNHSIKSKQTNKKRQKWISTVKSVQVTSYDVSLSLRHVYCRNPSDDDRLIQNTVGYGYPSYTDEKPD